MDGDSRVYLIPEPSAVTLLLGALGVVLLFRRRRA
jgi:hypothetical protein